MKKRLEKKMEKRKREQIHRLLDLALDINGLEPRKQDITGSLPTAFFLFFWTYGLGRDTGTFRGLESRRLSRCRYARGYMPSQKAYRCSAPYGGVKSRNPRSCNSRGIKVTTNNFTPSL